ncbi:FAD-dependent oxidoreductase [Bradyrhizobium oligotrophicum]|uniref:FAD-dependent oxidoreductase n=1 Tax=Bradyrhizobium oligotrophicum TaxID=44255 RepID=UPI003EB6F4D8
MTIDEAASRHRVAIIGGGPSGFYAAEALLRSGQPVDVDMFERLPVPYGLVRFGVAPDHPKLKQVTRVFDRIAEMPGFRFFGGVELGGALTIDALRACYHAVVLATGAAVDRRLDVPGETLQGCHTAGDFVGWYNGHPDFRHLQFDLGVERAVVIGHGNVALDIARILAKTADELRQTDIAAHALDVLAESRIREIHVIGRRGPHRTRFAAKELSEFADLSDCEPVVDAGDLAAVSFPAADDDDAASLALLREFAARPVTRRRRCVFAFDLSPQEIEGTGRVERIWLDHHPEHPAGGAPRRVALACGLVITSIGRRAAPIGGIPYDDRHGVHANVVGRIIAEGAAVPGLYVCGWGKRGPQGTIGTNRACSVETIAHLLSDLPQLAVPPRHPDSLLGGVAIPRHVDYRGWGRIDAAEVVRGRPSGKPREKLVAVDEMFAAAAG